MFITFEGGEGAGKSTQVRKLADHLQAKGIQIVVTREPGGSPGAEAIRTLLVEGGTDRWSPMSEALLNFAARKDHINKTIKPALKDGAWVLCDRFADSTVAYQGYGHQMGGRVITDLWHLAIEGFKPDLTVIFDMPVEEGLKRAKARGDNEDRYERMGLDFHQRLRTGFIEIAQSDPGRCQIIDATGSIDEVFNAILAVMPSKT